MSIVEIKTVTSLIEVVKFKGTRPDTENYFRGHSDSSFDLVPGIYRKSRIEFEDKLFREMILRVPHEFSGLRTAIEFLVKMQHYGLPTRLLDITLNPLVALYFACIEFVNNKDGEVIFLQIPKSHIKFFDSDTVTFLSNIAKMPSYFSPDFSSLDKSEFNDQESIHRLHHYIKDEKPYYHPIIDPKEMEEVFAVKVKLGNSRILKQNGAFLIFGIQGTKLEPARVKADWKATATTGDRYIIPRSAKQEILHELELMGINRSTLFPEIDFQAQYLVDALERKIGPFTL